MHNMAKRSTIEEKLAYLAELATHPLTDADLKELKKALAAAGDLRASAECSLKVAEGRYRHGAGSMLELVDARAAFYTAQAEFIRAVFVAYSRAVLYSYATGREVIP